MPDQAQPAGRAFVKMHGLGNDFVVFDARSAPLALDDGAVRALADRRTGIGCDQVIILHPDDGADLRMEIRNADGGEAESCGNAARCIARLILEEGGEEATIETRAGTLHARRTADGISVDMGVPGLDWREIPLAEPVDTNDLNIAAGPLERPAAVSMGNPHMIFFVPAEATIDLARLGPALETHPLFPERANVSVARILDAHIMRLDVWERGAGLTRACGTAACAALVAAHRRGLAGPAATVVLPGGRLAIRRGEDGHVHMAGPAETVFSGRVALP